MFAGVILLSLFPSAPFGADSQPSLDHLFVRLLRRVEESLEALLHALHDDVLVLHSRTRRATIPPDGVTLASNSVSDVQALEISRGSGHFVGVQYHPEHTFATTAAIIEARQELMVAEGFAHSVEALRSVIADLRTLETDPGRRDIAWKLGVDKQVLDPRQRTAELGNWLRARVLPRRAARAAAA